MTLRWYYSVDASTVLEITDRVRLPLDPEGEAIGVGSHADAGSGWEGDLLVDDPEGDLIMLQFRRIYAVQDAAPAGGQVVGNWFISNTDIERMDPWSLVSRRWVVTMADENSLFNRRKFVGADADRPEETDIERIRWFLTTTEGNLFSPDETYIDTTNPVTVDATDLRTQGPEDMMMSLFQASQKDYWAKYEEAAATGGAIVSSSVANPTVITTTSAHGLTSGQSVVIAGHSGSTPTINGTRVVTVTGATTFTIPVNVTVGGTGGTTTTIGRYVIWYADMNTSELYPSTISFSNDPADAVISADNPTSLIYPLSDDARLSRAGARMASRLVGQYKAGWIESTQDTVTGEAYAYVERTVPIPNTSTAAKALAQINTQQQELAVPDDEITTVWTVQEARLNLLMHGMLTSVHATHFPNYTETNPLPGYADGFVPCRAMARDIRQIGPTTFQVPLRLSPMAIVGEDEIIATKQDGIGFVGVTWDVAPVAGQLLVACLTMRAGAGTPALPSGWGQIATTVTIGPDGNVISEYPALMAYKYATAGETISPTFTGARSTGGSTACFYKLSGWSGAPTAVVSKDEQASASSFDSGNLTPTAGARTLLIGFFSAKIGEFTPASYTPGASITEDMDLAAGPVGPDYEYYAPRSFAGHRIIATASGSYSLSATATQAGEWCGMAAVFEA